MTRWLIGADGARSVVARSLGFKFISKPGGIQACNVLFRADLSNHMLQEERQAVLSWVVNPEHKTFPGLVGHLRVVRPWNEWVMAAFGPGGSNAFDGLTLDYPRIIACIREMVGDESIDVKVLAMDPLTVRELIAGDYKRPDMNALIMGDAAHRHPPTYGLGSNTCVQDAYNLAWKIAFVSRGLASPDLLGTYSAERQPVGAELVRESNQQLRANYLI
ncbi:FAD-binding domain-containing protein 20 [Elsinoe australis]|uniref:FAD-binding domain-containing protein 20 n=1 Tax=Elsinoe australis TaxID=40998 RepID=A0A4U7B278_9PEZI|nr:FAD-binding domain-containing protein 20 [Elsinoe australis]